MDRQPLGGDILRVCDSDSDHMLVGIYVWRWRVGGDRRPAGGAADCYAAM